MLAKNLVVNLFYVLLVNQSGQPILTHINNTNATMQTAHQRANAEEYTSPQLFLMEIATEQGIAISDTSITVPDFGEEQEW